MNRLKGTFASDQGKEGTTVSSMAVLPTTVYHKHLRCESELEQLNFVDVPPCMWQKETYLQHRTAAQSVHQLKNILDRSLQPSSLYKPSQGIVID